MSRFQWAKADARWYLGVRCKKCRGPIAFALDRSEGVDQENLPAAGKLVLTCSLDPCKHKADYTAAAVFRFQKRPGETNQNHENSESPKGRQHSRS